MNSPSNEGIAPSSPSKDPDAGDTEDVNPRLHFRVAYDRLRKVYEARLRRMYKRMLRTIDDVRKDPLLRQMNEDPSSAAFATDRCVEIVRKAIDDERELHIRRLAEQLASRDSALILSHRKQKELEVRTKDLETKLRESERRADLATAEAKSLADEKRRIDESRTTLRKELDTCRAEAKATEDELKSEIAQTNSFHRSAASANSSLLDRSVRLDDASASTETTKRIALRATKRLREQLTLSQQHLRDSEAERLGLRDKYIAMGERMETLFRRELRDARGNQRSLRERLERTKISLRETRDELETVREECKRTGAIAEKRRLLLADAEATLQRRDEELRASSRREEAATRRCAEAEGRAASLVEENGAVERKCRELEIALGVREKTIAAKSERVDSLREELAHSKEESAILRRDIAQRREAVPEPHRLASTRSEIVPRPSTDDTVDALVADRIEEVVRLRLDERERRLTETHVPIAELDKIVATRVERRMCQLQRRNARERASPLRGDGTNDSEWIREMNDAQARVWALRSSLCDEELTGQRSAASAVSDDEFHLRREVSQHLEEAYGNIRKLKSMYESEKRARLEREGELRLATEASESLTRENAILRESTIELRRTCATFQEDIRTMTLRIEDLDAKRIASPSVARREIRADAETRSDVVVVAPSATYASAHRRKMFEVAQLARRLRSMWMALHGEMSTLRTVFVERMEASKEVARVRAASFATAKRRSEDTVHQLRRRVEVMTERQEAYVGEITKLREHLDDRIAEAVEENTSSMRESVAAAQESRMVLLREMEKERRSFEAEIERLDAALGFVLNALVNLDSVSTRATAMRAMASQLVKDVRTGSVEEDEGKRDALARFVRACYEGPANDLREQLRESKREADAELARMRDLVDRRDADRDAAVEVANLQINALTRSLRAAETENVALRGNRDAREKIPSVALERVDELSRSLREREDELSDMRSLLQQAEHEMRRSRSELRRSRRRERMSKRTTRAVAIASSPTMETRPSDVDDDAVFDAPMDATELESFDRESALSSETPTSAMGDIRKLQSILRKSLPALRTVDVSKTNTSSLSRSQPPITGTVERSEDFLESIPESSSIDEHKPPAPSPPSVRRFAAPIAESPPIGGDLTDDSDSTLSESELMVTRREIHGFY